MSFVVHRVSARPPTPRPERLNNRGQIKGANPAHLCYYGPDCRKKQVRTMVLLLCEVALRYVTRVSPSVYFPPRPLIAGCPQLSKQTCRPPVQRPAGSQLSFFTDRPSTRPYREPAILFTLDLVDGFARVFEREFIRVTHSFTQL